MLHALSFVPVTLLGIYFMAREGLTLAAARKMAEEQRQDADAEGQREEASGGRQKAAPDGSVRTAGTSVTRSSTRGRAAKAMSYGGAGSASNVASDSRVVSASRKSSIVS